MNEAYVIISGNVIDGLDFTGPFETLDDALNYAEKQLIGTDAWCIGTLYPPEG